MKIMKNITNFLIPILLLAGYSLSAQVDCQVLKPEISGQYFGKCKDGLAQGKGKAVGRDTYEGQFSKGLPQGNGTYTWSNGDNYVGEWEAGLRQGEGTMKFKKDGKDTVLAGIWEEDKYIGPKPPKPRVISSTNVDRTQFNKTGDTKARVLIEFYQNGTRNTRIENLLLQSSSGTLLRMGPSMGFENIIAWPVTIKATYTTMNKAGSQSLNAVIEFEISEPGDWIVNVYN